MAAIHDHNTDGASASSVAIHRVRFVNWSPSTVTALAVSPAFSGAARGLLAIGRHNGNIELCTWVGPRAAQKSEFDDRSFQSDAAGWAVHTVLPGQVNSKIEHLCFANPPTQDATQPRRLRLFSISGGSIVTEHFIPCISPSSVRAQLPAPTTTPPNPRAPAPSLRSSESEQPTISTRTTRERRAPYPPSQAPYGAWHPPPPAVSSLSAAKTVR